MLDINFTLVILAVNFLVLMFILNKNLFIPITKILDEREGKVNSRLDNAKKYSEQSETKENQYVESLSGEKKKSVIEQAESRKVVLDEGMELVKKAQEEANVKLGEVKKTLLDEKKKASETLSEQTEVIAKELAEKIINARV